MWIHLVALGLIDGAGGDVATPVAGGWYDDAKPKKKKLIFAEPPKKEVEQVAEAVEVEKVEAPKIVAKTIEPVSVDTTDYAALNQAIAAKEADQQEQAKQQALQAIWQAMEQDEEDIELLLLY